jgi:hypothetical protein
MKAPKQCQAPSLTASLLNTASTSTIPQTPSPAPCPPAPTSPSTKRTKKAVSHQCELELLWDSKDEYEMYVLGLTAATSCVFSSRDIRYVASFSSFGDINNLARSVFINFGTITDSLVSIYFDAVASTITMAGVTVWTRTMCT